MRPRVLVPALLVGLCATTGCSSSDGGESSEAGPGLPVQLPDETYPGRRSQLQGVVVLRDNGCFYAEVNGRELFVIWPREASWGGDAVRTPEGPLRDGDVLLGHGTVMPADELSGNRYWQEAHLGFCAPDETELLVLDDVTLPS